MPAWPASRYRQLAAEFRRNARLAPARSAVALGKMADEYEAKAWHLEKSQT